MSIRPFAWRDLPILLRYRHRGLFFDNTIALTRGQMLVPTGAIFSFIAPATGIFTYFCSNSELSDEPIMGQAILSSGSPLARLCFLAPESELESEALYHLLDYMIVQLGERGALHMLAEVNERTVAFELLRQASFAVYVRQRLWLITSRLEEKVQDSAWRSGRDRDIIAVRSLYNNLVPGLVQQVEPPPTDHLHGLVYYKGDELMAYAEIRYGAKGIWVQPFIHPDAEAIPARLTELLRTLTNRSNRPVYFCVRSYQSWLEHSLEDLGAAPGPIQVVMVKHLAISKRVSPTFALPALEGGKHEVSTPFARTENQH